MKAGGQYILESVVKPACSYETGLGFSFLAWTQGSSVLWQATMVRWILLSFFLFPRRFHSVSHHLVWIQKKIDSGVIETYLFKKIILSIVELFTFSTV